MELSQKYLEPQVLARIKDLELAARQTIEGLVSGGHKSPFQGVSIEFAEHREYVPGDDTRHLDWKLYAKTEKFYLKRYEQETNLICNLVLDTSQSMNYKSVGRSKLEYAAFLSASLAYLVLHQGDSLGMTFFEDRIRYLVAPASQPSHLKQILHLLAVCQPSNLRGQIGNVLNQLAGRFHKRSLVIVLSDCFDDTAKLLTGLKHLRHKRHEVVLFHVLDPAELEFPFRDMTMFKGLESLPDVLADPKGLRQAYLAEFGGFLKTVERDCRTAGIDYQRVRTDQPLGQVLANYLANR